MAHGASSRRNRRSRRQGLSKARGPAEQAAVAVADTDFAALAHQLPEPVEPDDAAFAEIVAPFLTDTPPEAVLEPMADDECSACGHPFSMHDGEDGECAGEGCDCVKFDAGDTAALLAAAGDVQWGPEEGFGDLAYDLNELLNGYSEDGEEQAAVLSRDEEAYVLDISLDLTRALVAVMDWAEWVDSVYVVPITVTGDEPTAVAPRADWARVEAGWVEVTETLGLDAATWDTYRDRMVQGLFASPRLADATPETNPLAAMPERLRSALSITLGEPARTEPGPLDGMLVVSPAKLDGFIEGLLASDTDEQIVRRFSFLFDHPSALVADGVAVTPAEQPIGTGELAWTATLCPEGHATVDGRIMAPGAGSWRELPLSLCRMLDSPHSDVVTEAPVCGRIDRVWRAGNLVKAAGVFSDTDVGVETAGMVERKELRGISVDTAIQLASLERRAQMVDDQGDWLDTAPAGPTGVDAMDLLVAGIPTIFVMWELVIGAATVCPFQAFDNATIEFGAPAALKAAGSPAVVTITSDAGWHIARPDGAQAHTEAPSAAQEVVAAAPVTPPAEWFEDPQLDEPTPLVVTDDGRVYGHAALWDTCHIGFPDACVTCPHSEYGYAFYHLKSVKAADGSVISCGTITMDTPHAPSGVGRAAAARHYDDTGAAVADVVTGEDAFGPWVAGALRPGVTDEQVRALRGSALSGDWRRVSGNLELIAWLAVNVPGFPVPRPEVALVASADGPHIASLIAVGVNVDGKPTGFDQSELDEIVAKLEEFAAAEPGDDDFAGLAATIGG